MPADNIRIDFSAHGKIVRKVAVEELVQEIAVMMDCGSAMVVRNFKISLYSNA